MVNKGSAMNGLTPRILLLVVCATLFACGEHYDDYYHDNGDHHAGNTVDTPILHQFHMIDTYGTNSEFDPVTHLAVSPFINAGQFEIFWDTQSTFDYFVEVRINDAPTTDRSRLISSNLCGPDYYCHDHQYQFCDYSSGFDIFCEASDGSLQSEYIGDLIETIPQDLYFILQVCDTGFYYCEYETRAVSVE